MTQRTRRENQKERREKTWPESQIDVACEFKFFWVNIGGPDTGYIEGTETTLGWSLLMSLRYPLLTRPVVYNGEHLISQSMQLIAGRSAQDYNHC